MVKKIITNGKFQKVKAKIFKMKHEACEAKRSSRYKAFKAASTLNIIFTLLHFWLKHASSCSLATSVKQSLWNTVHLKAFHWSGNANCFEPSTEAHASSVRVGVISICFRRETQLIIRCFHFPLNEIRHWRILNLIGRKIQPQFALLPLRISLF